MLLNSRGLAAANAFRVVPTWVSSRAMADPVGWAMGVLGLSAHDVPPPKGTVQRGYRDALLAAHPDHGGAGDQAAQRIADIGEARRILLAR